MRLFSHFPLILAMIAALPLTAQVDPVVVDVPWDTVAAPLITAQPLTPDTAVKAEHVLPKDSVDWRQRHSPRRASLLSAVLPGAGQIYNRKYWKAPIVWAGIGVSCAFIVNNTKEYRRYKDAYIAMVDNDPNTVDEFNGQYTSQAVLNVTDTYRRWRDLSYIAVGAVYMLNLIDASVDAHFVRFDVSPDLSLNLGPSLPMAAQGAAGLSFALALR